MLVERFGVWIPLRSKRIRTICANLRCHVAAIDWPTWWPCVHQLNHHLNTQSSSSHQSYFHVNIILPHQHCIATSAAQSSSIYLPRQLPHHHTIAMWSYSLSCFTMGLVTHQLSIHPYMPHVILRCHHIIWSYYLYCHVVVSRYSTWHPSKIFVCLYKISEFYNFFIQCPFEPIQALLEISWWAHSILISFASLTNKWNLWNESSFCLTRIGWEDWETIIQFYLKFLKGTQYLRFLLHSLVSIVKVGFHAGTMD